LWYTSTGHAQVHSKLLDAYNNPNRSMPCFYDSDGGGDSASGRQNQLRKNAWAAFTAGGNVNFIYAAGDVPDLRHYINYLQTFKETMNWVAMAPNDGLVTSGYCLANPGTEYAVYLPNGGPTTVDLSAIPSSTALCVRWYNPRDDDYSVETSVQGGEHRSFTAPDGNDWVLQIDIPVLPGDVNLDGDVNGLDVDPFVDLVLASAFQVEADMNEDGSVNGLDVDPFVDAVVGGGATAVPEPSAIALLALAGLAAAGWATTRCRSRR
jgi:hypothetical protein